MVHLSDAISSRMPKSQLRMQNAFVELLGEMDICERADVNRKTFYDYYQNKFDVYDSLTLRLLNDLFGFFLYEKGADESEEEALHRDIGLFLEFIDENFQVIAVLLDPRYRDRWAPFLSGIVEGRKSVLFAKGERRRSCCGLPPALVCDAVASQLIVWLYWWMGQAEYSIEEGVDLLAKLLMRSPSALLRYGRGAADASRKAPMALSAAGE